MTKKLEGLTPRQRIYVDITLYAAEADRDLLLYALDYCETAGEFQTLTRCRWVDGHRVYSPKPLLRELVKYEQ